MANVITVIRIICALNLVFCPIFSSWFYSLYMVCGISDVLDGTVARYLQKDTELGAQLDTIADIVFIAITIIKVVSTIDIPMWIIIWIVCIAIIKSTNIFCGFVIDKKFISEHTVMNKICGVLLFTIPLCIGQLSVKAVAVLMILTCGFATFAAVQEGYYIRIGKIIN